MFKLLLVETDGPTGDSGPSLKSTEALCRQWCAGDVDILETDGNVLASHAAERSGDVAYGSVMMRKDQGDVLSSSSDDPSSGGSRPLDTW